MTLKELYDLVLDKRVKGAIGKHQLMARHERLLARMEHYMGQGSVKVSIKVYESGYVLYEEDRRFTVFHLNDVCGEPVEYASVDESVASKAQRTIPRELFLGSEWHVRLMLEGNDRIMHNREKVERDHVQFSHSEYAEDSLPFFMMEDFVCGLQEQVIREKRKEVFEKLKRELRPIQWEVYVLIEKYGKTQQEVADYLGISQQAVSKDYKRAILKVEMLRDGLRNFFYED